ncbi:MAG TPA: hypothetical protein VII66_13110 [Gemmatimonadaceae bacterium]
MAGRNVFTGGQTSAGSRGKTGNTPGAKAMSATTGYGNARAKPGDANAMGATTGYRTQGSNSKLPSKLQENSGYTGQPAARTATPGAPQSGNAAVSTAKLNQKALNG